MARPTCGSFGAAPGAPSALLDADPMRQFLKEQRDQFDFIVHDCPPTLVVADALSLGPLVDAVLVVADARRSDRELVSRIEGGARAGWRQDRRRRAQPLQAGRQEPLLGDAGRLDD